MKDINSSMHTKIYDIFECGVHGHNHHIMKQTMEIHSHKNCTIAAAITLKTIYTFSLNLMSVCAPLTIFHKYNIST